MRLDGAWPVGGTAGRTVWLERNEGEMRAKRGWRRQVVQGPVSTVGLVLLLGGTWEPVGEAD